MTHTNGKYVMYLKHFGFNEFPFSLTPNLLFFCNLMADKEAFNVIMVSLHNGEGFIKITGEVGTGKTLLCRKLLNTLNQGRRATTPIGTQDQAAVAPSAPR